LLIKKKQYLAEVLDKNQLYVNHSSLNDKDFGCTEAEKKARKYFYQIKNGKANLYKVIRRKASAFSFG